MTPKIEVLTIRPSRKPSALADVKIRLTFDPGTVIEVDDLRVIRNKYGELWVANPTYSLQDGPKSYRYEKVCDFSRQLTREISDAVIGDFAKWEAARNQTNGGAL